MPSSEQSAPGSTPVTFLVHPRADVSGDYARDSPLLGLLPTRAYEWGFQHLPVPPLQVSTLAHAEDPARLVGRVVSVHLTPRQMLGDPALARRRVTAAVDAAAARGDGLVGLGALTAPVTSGGAIFGARTDIGVTNGNAFTAAVTAESVLRALSAAPRGGVALVGASGSVGSAVSRLLARAGVQDLVLVGRTPASLEALADELAALSGERPTTSTTIGDVRRCGLVVLLTSAAEALLRSEHVGPDTVVIDDTQPRNTSPELMSERPDVRLLDGGIVDTPGITRRGNSLGLARHQSYACLAETILLGLAGHRGHGTLGRPTLEQVDAMVRLSQRFGALGFSLAAPTAFGRPVEALWDTSGPAFSHLALSLPRVRA